MDPTDQPVADNRGLNSGQTSSKPHLRAVARLLREAARTVWARADDAGPTSPLQSLGLGIYLAHSRAQLLLSDTDDREGLDTRADRKPSRDDMHDDEVDWRPGSGSDGNNHNGGPTAAQLLAQAEELTRQLPLRRVDVVHGSQLVVDLCDLIAEARHLDC